MIPVRNKITGDDAGASAIVAERVALNIRGLQHDKCVGIIVKTSAHVLIYYPIVTWDL